VKAVASARAAGHLLADNPANAGMREAGWEPWPELVARLVRTWGPAPTVTEGQAKGKDGRSFPATFYAWARVHEAHDGPQAGKPVRCVVVAHGQNAGWVRVHWASWREGLRGAQPTTAQQLGVDAAEVFGATSYRAPAPKFEAGPRWKGEGPMCNSCGGAHAVVDCSLLDATEDEAREAIARRDAEDDAAERAAIEAEG
jgi:hypothetical protein